MLVELLSTSNYISFNIKLAELLGLHSAIYLSELMNINDKAIRKGKLDNNYFKLKREYIASRTTFSEKEQLEIEKNLLKLGILEKGTEDNDLSLNITMLTTLMMSTDESLIDNMKKLTKLKTMGTKKTKAEAIRDNLKTNIVVSETPEGEELRKAYEDWIDAVFSKQGWMSKKAVVVAQQTINNYNVTRDLDLALKLLDIAAVNGYRDISWAINAYEKDYKVNYRVVPNKQQYTKQQVQLSSEVF